jgi:hypothetical protein
VVGAPPHWQPIPLRSIVCQCGELLLGSGLLQTNLYTIVPVPYATTVNGSFSYRAVFSRRKDYSAAEKPPSSE